MESELNLLKVLDALTRYLPILRKEGSGYLEYTIDLGVKVISLGRFNLKNPQLSLSKESIWIGLWIRILESTGWDYEMYTTKEGKTRYYWIRVIHAGDPSFVVEETYPVRHLYFALPDILLKSYQALENRSKTEVK